MAKDEKSYNKLESRYEDKIVEQSDAAEELENSDILCLELTKAEADHLERNRNVQYIEENILLTGSTAEIEEVSASGTYTESEVEAVKDDAEGTEDGMFDLGDFLEAGKQDINQWNLDAIHWSASYGGTDEIKIALIDSGVSYSSDIPVQENVCFIPGEEEVSVLYEDGSGHGTAMAGLIAATDNREGITGVAPGSSLYSLRVLDDQNTCTLGRLVKALDWAIENHMDIINLSLGTTVDSEILHQKIRQAQQAGCLIIAAGGNEESVSVEYPAAYPEVMAVGATDPSGLRVGEYASGEELEVLAPGKELAATTFLDGIMVIDGSSASAAEVTGAAALLWSRDHSASAECIRRLLQASAMRVENSDMAGQIDLACADEHFDEFLEHVQESEVTELVISNSAETENFEDVVAKGLWDYRDHAKMIDGSLISSQRGQNLAKHIITLADTVYGNNKRKACPALHGGDNYVLFLKYLFYMTKFLKAGRKIAVADQKAYEKCADAEALKNKTTLGQLENLRTTTIEILTKRYIYQDETSSSDMSAKVMGFALHLIGDVFAHRTIVPSYTIKDCKTILQKGKNSRFGTRDFYSIGCTKHNDSDRRDWARLSGGSSGKDSFCHTWKCFKSMVEGGYVEFRDIRHMQDFGSPSITKDNPINMVYEDNPSFCPGRFEDTKDACFMFCRLIRDGEKFDYMIFWSEHDCILNNYHNYTIKAGETDIHSQKMWNEISTQRMV